MSYEEKLEEKVDEDSGATYYEGIFENVEGTIDMVITDADDSEEVPYEVAVGTPAVMKEDGKVYLVDGELKMDITEDAKYGKASGSYDKDELTYEYEVTEKEGTWELSISNEDNAEE